MVVSFHERSNIHVVRSSTRRPITPVKLSPCELAMDLTRTYRPCSHCLKKGRAGECEYAPQVQKQKPVKGMAARLKRLEGMVRDMLDVEGGENVPQNQAGPASTAENAALSGGGKVVQGDGARGTTYVGATHFMAMLDDVCCRLPLRSLKP